MKKYGFKKCERSSIFKIPTVNNCSQGVKRKAEKVLLGVPRLPIVKPSVAQVLVVWRNIYRCAPSPTRGSRPGRPSQLTYGKIVSPTYFLFLTLRSPSSIAHPMVRH